MPQPELEAALAELDRVRDRWLRRPGVTAVDVGFRTVGGAPTDELAIRVHVERKLPEASLPAEQLFPSRLGRFPVDVIEARYGPHSAPDSGGLPPPGPHR